MLNKLSFIIIKILSYSPIFRITDDRLFGEVRKEFTDKENIRISLFSINIGDRIIHFFTYRFSDKKFKPFYILSLSKVHPFPNLKDINKSYDEYKDELSKISQEKYLTHKETLMHKISQIEAVKNKTFNKFLAYISIIAFILPLFSAQFTKLYSIEKSYQKIFVFYVIYLFINLICFIYKFIKVQGINRVTFRSIRRSPEPLMEFVLLLYYEWKTLTQESTFQVTIIKNIEKYMTAIIIWCIAFISIYNLDQYISENYHLNHKPMHVQNTNSNFIHLKDSNSLKEFLKDNNQQLDQIKEGLLENKYVKVVVLSDNQNNNYKKLLEFLHTYNINDTEIIEINDNTFSNFGIILLEEGE